MNEMPDMDEDELTDELVDLIEHEPKQTGFSGVSKDEHSKYMDRVFAVIERLKA